jgi:hypothetical protein
MCEELDIDVAFPAKENHSNGMTQPGPVAEGAAAGGTKMIPLKRDCLITQTGSRVLPHFLALCIV